MKKILSLFLVGLIIAACFPMMAAAGSQDFTLVNKTGFDIYEIYVSPYQTDKWEDEIMEQEVLADGESLDITFDGYSETYWDILVKDQDGNSYYWRKIDLKKISKITLNYDGEDTWAELE